MKLKLKTIKNTFKKIPKILWLILFIIVIVSIILITIFLPHKKENKKNQSDKTNNNVQTNLNDDNNNNLKFINNMYPLFITSNGKKAYISFYEDGSCNPLFATLNNCGKEVCVFYNDSSKCTYEVDSNNIISINWDGYYELKYSYKLGNGTSQSSVIGNGYIMKGAKLQYYPEYNTVDLINGKWDIIYGNDFYYIYFLNENNQTTTTTQEKPNNNSTNNNDNNYQYNENNPDNFSQNNNSNDSNNNDLINQVYTKVSKTGHDKNVSILIDADYVEPKDFIRTFKINKKEYPVGEWAELDLYQTGNNCYDVEIVDIYNNTKNLKACYDFYPEDPKFNINSDDCIITIRKDGFYERGNYNELKALTWYLDGNILTKNMCSYEQDYIKLKEKINSGTHTIKGINEFGIETVKSFDC